MPNPLDDGLRTRVQAAVDAEITRQGALLAEIGEEMTSLVSAVSTLLRGGKRLRAAFLYWGYRAAGGPDSDALVRSASAMEFFQAAALLHDDVMDNSDTRRGQPAAHRRLAGEHLDAGWGGEPDRFGEAGAILAGDLCLAWSDQVFATSGLPPEQIDRARPVFDRMRTQLMGGQFLDVLESVRGWEDATAEERVRRSRRVIRYKSAKYSVEHPLLIGATAAGAGPNVLTSLSDYGLALGEAFQLRDDVLGVFGDPEQTGKPAGDDLREGKRTVLLAHTLNGASPQDAATIAGLLGDAELHVGEVDRMREIIRRTDGLARTEQLIAERATLARQALGRVTVPTTGPSAPEGMAALDALIDVSTARSN